MKSEATLRVNNAKIGVKGMGCDGSFESVWNLSAV